VEYEIINQLKVPACVINHHGEMIFQNLEYSNLISESSDNITLDENHEFYNEYRRRLAVCYNRALEGNSSKSFVVIRTVKKKKLPVELYLYPVKFSSEENGIFILLNIVDDRVVSFDRKLQDVHASDPLYDFSPFPIITLDENQVVTKASSAALHLFSTTLDQLQRKSELLFSFFSISKADKIKNAVIEIIKRNKSFVRFNDIHINTEGEKERYVNIVIYPVSFDSDNCNVEMIFEEITKVKTLENKLSQMNKVRIFSDMTKGLLHSFNNIINIIINRTQMLQQLSQKENVQEGLNSINESAMEAATQIRRIQEFITPDSDSIETTTDIIEVIRDAIEFATIHFKVENKEKGRNISINKQYYTKATLTGNMKILREIIVSMIFRMASAIKQKGTVEIVLKREDDIILTVSVNSQFLDDDKINLMESYIPEIELRRISEKINIRILEEDSTDGISYKAILPAKMIKNEKSVKQENETPKIRDCDILIVEDEPALQEILQEVFDFMGNRVIIHSDGESAIQELNNYSFDIAISDYGLKGMTGIELLAKIREHNEKCINVLLSGWVLEDISMYQSSIDLFLQKPFQLDELFKKIGSLMP
jgi:CheY-like chemotaxis protein